MSKYVRLLLFFILAVCVLSFASCSQPKNEAVDIKTDLTINSSFKGSRSFVVTFPDSVIASGSEKESSLDKVVQKYCPDSMNYSKMIKDGLISYSFELKFNSLHDYIKKTSDIIGTQTVVTFSNPNNALTTGWKLNESFTSKDLLFFIADGAHTEKLEGLELELEESRTTAALGDEKVNTTEKIAVNTLKGQPVQKITIKTVNKGSVFDRTIVFNISQSTFDALGDALSKYFKDITNPSAESADWLLENKSYLYTVKFTDISLQQLEGYTNKLLSSVYCDVSYEDKSVGSTPLAEQNSYTETLDFSNYFGIGGGNVPVEYSYSVDGSSELGECRIYDGTEWTAATDLLSSNKYGSLVAIKSNEALLVLKINDGKQYTASSIDVNVTPLDDDKIQKSVIFKYDIATGGIEACEYTKSYFENIDIGAVESLDGEKKVCTVTFSGTADEINRKMGDIFGTGNKLTYSSYKQFMRLRTMKQFTDHIDFSSLIISKNIDTPVNYYITAKNGDIVKSFTAVSQQETGEGSDTEPTSVNAELTPDKSGAVSISLNSSSADLSFDVSVANLSEIIMCIIISCLVVIIALAVLLVLRSRKAVDTLPHGENDPTLPEPKVSLSKTKLNEQKRRSK